MNHSLLLSKLEGFGFSRSSLTLIQSYLCNRFERTKVNASFSDLNEVLAEIPQGFVLDPFLFNIFLKDIFFFITNSNICNYPDNILHVFDKNLHIVKSNLKANFALCKNNFMKYTALVPVKCYFVNKQSNKPDKVNLNRTEITSSKSKKLLCMFIYKK